MITVALLSRWHVHADDYAKEISNSNDFVVKTIWDEDELRGRQWAGELDVAFEKHLDNVLQDHAIDAVVINSPTVDHKKIILAAAKNKKHIFTEKVLAMSVQDCDEIFAAVKEANVELIVSLPRLSASYYLFAQDTVDKGLIGKLTSIRCRLAHNGAVPSSENPDGWLPSHFYNLDECGGGALIDLGAHPIYLLNRLAGTPVALMATKQSVITSEVDDNSVVISEYDGGTTGIVETSFVSGGSPFQLELYGTEGTICIEEENVKLKSNKLTNKDWQNPDSLPAVLPSPIGQWANAILGREASSITKEDIRNLTKVNQAAALSHEKKRKIYLKEVEGS